jgi:CheY-like chemotaxis protein
MPPVTDRTLHRRDPRTSSMLEILKTATFDVMLVDYSMPGMKGIELIERAKKLVSEDEVSADDRARRT